MPTPLDEESAPGPFVRLSVDAWRDYRCWLAQYEQELHDRADRDFWLHLYAFTCEESDRHARWLSVQAGLNVEVPTKRRRKAHNDEQDQHLKCYVAYRHWALFDLARKLTEKVLQVVPPEQRTEAVIKAHLFAFGQMPMLIYREYTHLYGGEGERAAGLLFLSGWVGSRTDLSSNRRLERYLETEAATHAEHYFDYLCQLLPERVLFTAERRRNRKWDANKFVNDVLGQITASVELPLQGYRTSDRETRKTVTHLTETVSAFAAEQDWKAHEEVRLASYDFDQAPLTSAERAAVVGDLAGYSDAEIARARGNTASTVRNQRATVRKKLRGA